MNKVAYLILAHKNPKQLKRLTERLNDERTVFYIHIDVKQDISQFERALGGLDVHWIKRERSQWGSIGMVKAILNGFEQIVKDASIQRVTLLSGMDYPIKSLSKILAFYDAHPDHNYIDIVSFEESGWREDKKQRIKKHYFFFQDKLFEYPKNPKSSSLFRNALDLILRPFLVKQREFPEGLKPYGGFIWFSFNIGLVKSILDFHSKRPDLYRFNKKCLSSDEVFFHTIIGNIDDQDIELQPSITYAYWKDDNQAHPKTLGIEDLDKLTDSSCLFARKFDVTVDEKILDVIDQQLLLNT